MHVVAKSPNWSEYAKQWKIGSWPGPKITDQRPKMKKKKQAFEKSLFPKPFGSMHYATNKSVCLGRLKWSCWNHRDCRPTESCTQKVMLDVGPGSAWGPTPTSAAGFRCLASWKDTLPGRLLIASPLVGLLDGRFQFCCCVVKQHIACTPTTHTQTYSIQNELKTLSSLLVCMNMFGHE